MGDMLWTVDTVYQDKLIYDMGVYDNKGLRLKQDCMLYLQHTWRQKLCPVVTIAAFLALSTKSAFIFILFCDTVTKDNK